MHHIIANPHAGTRKILKIVNRLEQIFENAGFEYDVHYTTRVKDAEDTTREMYMHGERDFIVVGGDGTLHEVLNGLVDPTQCRLGLIPAGTGNDFAATVQIPEDVEKAAEICKNTPNSITTPTSHLLSPTHKNIPYWSINSVERIEKQRGKVENPWGGNEYTVERI